MKLIKSRFTEHLIRLNTLRFNKWIFEPGMLFLSETKWWGERGYRGHRHNGLDLLLYETDGGISKTIDENTTIPIIYEGKIATVIKDFLGYSLFAAHEIYDGDFQLYTIYGHVIQAANVFINKFLGEGDAIATLAGSPNAVVPGHLHISVALIPKAISLEAITWETLNRSDDIRFFDPRQII